MSDLENIIPASHKVELLGQEYELKFTFRHYAAIQQKFGKSPIELFDAVYKVDISAIVACLWGGTLQFEAFDPANPLKIKQEIEIEKLYEMGFFELNKAMLPLQLAILSSMPKKDEEIVEPEKKPEAPQLEQAL